MSGIYNNSYEVQIIMNKEKIGNNIKKAREMKGMSQKDFAKKIGVPASNLSNYEKGNIPTLEKLLKIADAAGVSLDWLCDYQPVPTLKDLLSWILTAYENDTYETQIGGQFETLLSTKDIEYHKDSDPIKFQGDRPIPTEVEYTLHMKDDGTEFNTFLLLFFSQLYSMGSISDPAYYTQWKEKYLEFASLIKLPVEDSVDVYKKTIDAIANSDGDMSLKKTIKQPRND